MTHKTLRLGIFSLIGVSLATPASAATENWATLDGNWAVDSNWLPAGVPASGDDVKIVFADAAHEQ